MNEYSSDTKKVAAKLAGMTDACANVYCDEPYATWAAVPDDLQWLAENVKECPCAYIKKTIGGHEAADMRNQFSSLGHYFTKAQWKRAREIYEAKEYCRKWDQSDAEQAKQDSQQTRIADAIMTEVGCDEVGYSQCVAAAEKVLELMQDSQQEWVNGRPPVGETCAIYDGNMGRWYEGIIDFISDDWCVFTAPDGQWCQSMAAMKFEPIPAEQKPDEQKDLIKSFWHEYTGGQDFELMKDEEMGFSTGVESFCEWLFETGRLTQGGGDE